MQNGVWQQSHDNLEIDNWLNNFILVNFFQVLDGYPRKIGSRRDFIFQKFKFENKIVDFNCNLV